MKLLIRCPSGLLIDFEGTLDELERFDGFLAELARLERDRLAPAPHGTENPAGSPHVAAFEPFPDPSPPTPPGVPVPAEGAGAPAPLPETAPPVVRRQQAPHEGRVIGASARAAMSAQLAERHGAHHAQALALVAEHGPVASVWVADQLVKNRRDTLALMRDMVVAGELVETDGYFRLTGRSAVRRMRADQGDPSRSKAAREQAKARRAERDAKKDRRA